MNKQNLTGVAIVIISSICILGYCFLGAIDLTHISIDTGARLV